MLQQILISAFLISIPVAFFIWRMKVLLRAEAAHSKSPFSEKLLRPPGESVRNGLAEADDEFSLQLVIAVIALVLPGAIFFLSAIQRQPSLPNTIVALIVVIPLFVLAPLQWRKLKQRREDHRNLRLGFDGERYVGAELHRLPGGYHVFHDFCFDHRPGGDATNFNIDHIVVGPTGVFAIETKAVRKRFDKQQPKGIRNKVIYDGKALDFSSGVKDSQPVNQARAQAQELATWLNSGLEKPIEVRPVVVIPGWFIDADKNVQTDVFVRSGKEIAASIERLRIDQLSESQVAAIAARLLQESRNVEGT